MPRVKRTVVILIAGKAESGKTTVKDILKEKLEGIPSIDVFPYSFANPIKYMAKAFGKWNGEKDEAGRKLLQKIGTDFREYNEDIWAIHFLTQMDRDTKRVIPASFAIIDDWRFPNELNYIKKNPLMNVVTIRVFGRGGLNGEVAGDITENSLPEVDTEFIPTGLEGPHWYDFQIDNSGDIELLNHKLDLVLAELTKQYIVE